MAELNSAAQKTSGARGQKKMNVRVDLTAMVDLAFLLITFFMLTTTLSKPKAMDVAMPVGTELDPVPASRSFTVCLGKNNRLMWYLGELKDPVIKPSVTGFDKDGIRKVLFKTANMVNNKTGKSMIVLVKPSDHAVYHDLVSVLDELNIANIPSYAIVDIDKADKEALQQSGVY